MKRPALK